eukprot:scaffold279412_cov23-Tisochrysis_lutea.AAC.1
MATQGPAKRDVPRGPQYATCAEVPFQRLSHFFGLVSGQIPLQGNVAGKGLPPRERSRLLRRFMELYMPRTHDTYEIMRLLAPDVGVWIQLWDMKGFYSGSEQESNVINWRTRGSSKFVGDFPEACHKVGAKAARGSHELVAITMSLVYRQRRLMPEQSAPTDIHFRHKLTAVATRQCIGCLRRIASSKQILHR